MLISKFYIPSSGYFDSDAAVSYLILYFLSDTVWCIYYVLVRDLCLFFASVFVQIFYTVLDLAGHFFVLEFLHFGEQSFFRYISYRHFLMNCDLSTHSILLPSVQEILGSICKECVFNFNNSVIHGL